MWVVLVYDKSISDIPVSVQESHNILFEGGKFYQKNEKENLVIDKRLNVLTTPQFLSYFKIQYNPK